MDWSGVDYCDVFISCLDSHSDGTHSLQSIHCWDTDAVTHFSKSDEETNSSTSWMAWGGGHLYQVFIFVWTIPLITKEIWHVTIHPSDLVCVRWSPLGAAGVSATLCAGVHQLLLFGRRASAHGLLFLLTFTTTTEVLHMNIHQWISTFVTP